MKILLIILLSLNYLNANSIDIQNNKFAIVTGFSINKYKYNDKDTFSNINNFFSPFKPGFIIGIEKLIYSDYSNKTLKVGLSYKQRGNSSAYCDATFNYIYASITFYLNNIKNNKSKFFIRFNRGKFISGKINYITLIQNDLTNEKTEELIPEDFNIDNGLSFGLEYLINKKNAIRMSYYLGLNDIISSENDYHSVYLDYVNAKNQAIDIALIHNFIKNDDKLIKQQDNNLALVAGVSISKIKLNDSDIFGDLIDIFFKPGFIIGIETNHLDSPLKFALSYKQRGYNSTILDSDYDETFNYVCASIAYYLSNVNKNRYKYFVRYNIGPFLSGKTKFKTPLVGLEESELDPEDFNIDNGLSFGLEYWINKKNAIRMSYYLGLNDIGFETDSNLNAKNRGIDISLIYNF